MSTRESPAPMRLERASVKARAKPCPVCTHLDRGVIDRALGIGQTPRSIVRRYAGLSRRAVQRHRDECLKAEESGA